MASLTGNRTHEANTADTREYNCDGLPGPTHNYAGLSYGNKASETHRGRLSNPREAAMQGLEKMRLLHDLGVPQAILPPQERPDITALRSFGFAGTDAQVLEKAAREAPILLACAASASSMWTANAATITPSADSADGRIHVTPANLGNKLHRALEASQTSRTLRAIFAHETHFAHHPPLAGGMAMNDEGAANHTRFRHRDGGPGLHFFVYGASALHSLPQQPARYPARHYREASEAIARRHGIPPERVLFVQQSPQAIDAGVFHNDVIATGHQHAHLYHEQAFVDTPAVIQQLETKFECITGKQLVSIPVRTSQVSLEEAVLRYLFNSQLVTPSPGAQAGAASAGAAPRMALIAPADCERSKAVRSTIEEILADPGNPISEVHYLDLRQSMSNGGGPACLRLRIELTDTERQAANNGVFFTEALYNTLKDWVGRHYRDKLHPEDLADPALLEESRRALDELTGILNLGSIYPFQQT